MEKYNPRKCWRCQKETIIYRSKYPLSDGKILCLKCDLKKSDEEIKTYIKEFSSEEIKQGENK